MVLAIKPRPLGRALSALTAEPTPQALCPCFYYGTCTAGGTQCSVKARLSTLAPGDSPAPGCF